MAKRKRPNLSKALKNIDNMDEGHFGNINIDISSLPCMIKPEKEKITANFDADLLEEIKTIAEKNNVSYTTLMNDVLREVFLNSEKKVG